MRRNNGRPKRTGTNPPRLRHWHDMRMVQLGNDPGLGEIPLGIFVARNEPPVRNLDGDEAFQLVVVGQIDESETSLAKTRCDNDRCAEGVRLAWTVLTGLWRLSLARGRAESWRHPFRRLLPGVLVQSIIGAC